jgi:hypothetical protein
MTRTGEILREMEKNKGKLKRGKSPQCPEENSGIKLSEIGVTRKESSLWQKLAAIPEKEFSRGARICAMF